MDLSQLQPIQTPESILKAAAKAEAVKYLQSTDWYVIRKNETGDPVPSLVSIKRAEARETINEA